MSNISNVKQLRSPEYVRKKIQKIVSEVIRPNADHIDREGQFPAENLTILGKAGWNSLFLPKSLGGLALDYQSFGIVTNEIAQACPSTALIYTMHTGASLIIYKYGNEDQWQRWLLPILDGKIGTIATSERSSGGSYWINQSKATYKDDGYLLNLEKSFATSSGYADFYVLQTRSPQARKLSDLCYFIVDGKQEGIETGKWDALGVRGNHSSSIQLTDIYVEKRDLIGEEGTGKTIIENSNAYIFGIGSAWTGTATGIFNEVVEISKRSSIKYPVIRNQLAIAKIKITGLTAWQNDISRRLDQWVENGGASLPVELRTVLIEFKVYASEIANEIAQIAMDIAGGFGYQVGTLERLYRDARAGIVMGPSNNLARDLIGKDIAGIHTPFWPEDE